MILPLFPGRPRSFSHRSLPSRTALAVIVPAALLAGGSQILPAARAQDAGAPALQPFQSTPSPAVDPPVRRALPAGRPAPPPSPARKAYPIPGQDAPYEPTPVPVPVREDDDLTTTRPLPTPAQSAVRPPPGIPPGTAQQQQQQQQQPPAPTPPRRPRPASPTVPAGVDPTAPAGAPSTGNGTTPAPDTGDGADEIRIAPQRPGVPRVAPDEAQINLANDLYRRKQFAQAAPEYERYLGQYPDGPQRQAAYWWLAEAYRQLGRPAPARSAYQNLLISYREGEYVGPANFRLAVMNFEDKDYAAAMPLFRRSATLAKADDVRISSRYFEALCLENLNRQDETLEVYDEVTRVTTNNPYRDDARQALARIAVAQKHPNEALKQYESLSRDAAKPAVQAESALRGGLIAKDLGQIETASTLLTRAYTLPAATAAIRAEAQIAQLHLLYDGNKYQRLLDTYDEAKSSLPEAIRTEAMLLAANSKRQLGQHTAAQQAYEEIMTQYPRSAQAPEARYQRIISLYASGAPNFAREADDFLLANGGAEPLKADQVRLMKADSFFTRKDYANAAVAYAALDNANNLPSKYRAEAAYRLGYCYAQTRQPEKTAAAFARFVRAFPEHPFVPKALVQRAVAYQQLKNYQSALADFNAIIDDYKGAREREIALQQKALILGQQDNERGMADTFRQLLKEYPKSDAAGLADYYIGRSLFNAKDYPGALAAYEAARKADPKEYGPKAALPVILCEYQLQQKEALAGEIEAYQKAKLQPAIPSEILRWLGESYLEAKNYSAAEDLLAQAAASPTNKLPDTWLILARTRLNLTRWDGALEASQKYLAAASPEPAVRAVGLLVQGEAQMELKQFDNAQKSADETLLLQPEGGLNAKARVLAGRIAYAKGDYEGAAKSFMSVSVLYDDPEITPQALRLAADALEKAGKPTEAAREAEELRSRFPEYAARKKTEG